MGRPMPQFGRSDAAFNVVPVDYVVAAMVAAAGDPATLGQTLHLVDPDPLTAHDLVDLLSRAYAGRAPRGRVPARGSSSARCASTVRELFGGTPRVDRLPQPPGDLRRAANRRPPCPHGLMPPKFPEYVQAMVEFFRAHEDDPALRPKPPAG